MKPVQTALCCKQVQYCTVFFHLFLNISYILSFYTGDVGLTPKLQRMSEMTLTMCERRNLEISSYNMCKSMLLKEIPQNISILFLMLV